MCEQKSYKSWTRSDIENYIPKRERDPENTYKCAPGRGRKPISPRQALEGIQIVSGCAGFGLDRIVGTLDSQSGGTK